MSRLKRRIFWVISRVAHAVYAKVPLFGTIRGAVAIIRRGNGFVMVDRSDGYGLGFPGGISPPWEQPDMTVRREVAEETGLEISGAEFKFDFRCTEPFAIHTHVFEVEVTGELRSSWEGTARVVDLSEMKRRVMSSQRPIVDYLVSSLERVP